MSVAETLDTVAALRDAKMPDPVIVVNQVLPPTFPKGIGAGALRLEAGEVMGILGEAGVRTDEPDAEELLRAVHDVEERRREERKYVTRLAKAAPVIELPFLFTPSFGPPEIESLSTELVA